MDSNKQSFSFASLNTGSNSGSGGLFGSNPPAATSANAPSSTIFGSAAPPASSAGAFGSGFTFSNPPGAASASAASSAPPGSGLQLGASSTPAKPSLSFGSTTPAATPPAPGGLAASQPAAPVQKPLFGAIAPGSSTPTSSSLFPLNKGTTPASSSFSLKPQGSTAPSSTPAGAPFGLPNSNPANAAQPAGQKLSGLFGAGAGASSPFAGLGSTSASTPSTSANPTPAPAATTAASSASNLFNIGAPPASAPAQSTAPSTTAPSLFGFPPKPTATPAAPAATTSAAAPAAATAASAAPSLFVPSGTNAGTTATTSAPPAPSLFGQVGGLGTTAAPSGLGASLGGGNPSAPVSRLKNKSMDEILTRWATDLNKYQKDFQKQAGQIAEWDRLLVDNSDKIGKLVTKTIAAERDATEVERQLKSVEDQQSELEQFLDKYEGQVDELVRSHGLENDTGVDAEREKTYKLAEKLTDRLDGLNKDLTEVIDEINNLGAMLNNSTGPDDPLSNIVRVLNNHLQKLQKIDVDATGLQNKVKEAQKQAKSVGTNGWHEGNPSDDFYKSFMRGR